MRTLAKIICVVGSTVSLGASAVSAQSVRAPVLKVVSSNHYLALLADSTIIGWGRYRTGQLGESPILTSRRRFGVAQPIAISVPGKVIDIAAGTDASYALLSDGTVYAWGANSKGELGIGTPPTPPLPNDEKGFVTPQRIASLRDVAQIYAHAYTAFAVMRDGTVRAWGNRDGGMVGDGVVPPRWGESMPNATTPVTVPGLSNVKQLAAVGGHVMALTSDGRVFGWGTNSAGQVGTGERSTEPISRPVEVRGITDVVSIAAGADVSAVLKRDGTVWVWGGYGCGLFGSGERDGTITATEGWNGKPTLVPGVRNVVSLSMSTGRHAIALLKDGSLRGWGNSDWGQVGAGVAGFFEWTPVVPKISGVTTVWAVGNNTFAVTKDGKFWFWGSEMSGTGVLAKNQKLPVLFPLP